MARQYLQDGGVLEPAIADPLAADTTTTILPITVNSYRYCLIPAFDARPGKVYIYEAGGLITTSASASTLTITPTLGTSGTAAGTTLGTSIVQTTPVSSLSGPWSMRMILICTDTGAVGANAHMKGTGWFMSGGVAATANSGMNINFGGTSVAFDHTVANTIVMQKTLSVAGSWTTQYIWFYPGN